MSALETDLDASALREAAATALAAAIERQGLGDDWPGPSVVARVVALVYPHAGEVAADAAA